MRVLVLAGTSEARALIGEISGKHKVVASLAGVTRDPIDLGCETRVGGFGGVDGLVKFLRNEQIEAVVDGTHPFAAQMTWNAAAACLKTDTRHVILQRRGWKPKNGDDWRFIAQFEEVAGIIPQGATVFLGTGRQTLDQFSGLKGRRLLCRVIDPPQRPFPFEGGEFVIGRPPFSVEEEVVFFKRENIEWLVVKNAGGERSRSKLDAARMLRLPVVMQKRPKRPESKVVWSVEDCLAWLDA
ncbi:cobalt-precorrin-6A reductase [Amylibacter sp.]|jgi:precorrin-6A/cobalt-precorrin-6A reductase|nr:cobalt-precorrin-6A reductase [Amylibacter sp.]